MITRTTWALIGVLGVLLAVFYFSQRSAEEGSVEATPTVGPRFLLEISEDQVVGLEIQGPDNQEIAIQREADGSWAVTGENIDQVDQAVIAGAVRQLGNLRLLSELDDVSDLEIYGLVSPRFMVIVELSDGANLEIAVGDTTPTGGGYYTQVGGQAPKVANLVNLDPILNLVINPPLFPTLEMTETVEPAATAEG